MINYDLDGDYELAKRILYEIYTTRIEYLGTSSGVGAHSLLHYSHFDYDELNQIGNDVDDYDYSETKIFLKLEKNYYQFLHQLFFRTIQIQTITLITEFYVLKQAKPMKFQLQDKNF